MSNVYDKLADEVPTMLDEDFEAVVQMHRHCTIPDCRLSRAIVAREKHRCSITYASMSALDLLGRLLDEAEAVGDSDYYFDLAAMRARYEELKATDWGER